MATLKNLLDQALDIAGSEFQTGSMTLADEPNFLGRPITGQTGAAASITVGADVVVSGLTGMAADSIGRFLTISGADTGANNGTFLIIEYTDANTVKISNPSAATDAYNGAISWTERRPYSLEDDLNFERTDRAAIKGVAYSAAIPTYQRPTAVGTNVPANLSNIAGKTTDAKALVVTRVFQNVSVAALDGYSTLTSVGNLKHADATDRTGVPINDGADAGADEATYVDIIGDGYQSGLRVLGGPQAGWRIYGRTRAGTTGTSPDSVEVEFRAVAVDAALSTSVAYTWEAGQPTTVDMYYGFRERLDNMSETALRVTLANGVIADSSLQADINDIRQTVGIGDGVTDLAGLLTNTGNYFPFSNLPDATPSVVEALNTLNAQIGNRDYTGTILTDGYTITQSLQQLADAISQASALRVIERVASDINAGTAHTIPGGNTYTLDGTNNGQNMWVFWRGLLQDPGPISGGNDYAETSTTSITPYTKIKTGDHINYFIIA
jgi:hypothetical protein